MVVNFHSAELKTENQHTHTHTRLMALFQDYLGTSARQVRPIWILLKQETVSGTGISWAICKSAPRSRQITTPAPHHSVFLQAACPSWHPTNSVKALKAQTKHSEIKRHEKQSDLSWHKTQTATLLPSRCSRRHWRACVTLGDR